MTITVTILFDAAEGQRDALIAKMIQIMPETLAYEGCERLNFAECTDESGSFVLVEDWQSEQHYEAYKAWRAESGTSVLASGLVGGRPQTEMFNSLEVQSS